MEANAEIFFEHDNWVRNLAWSAGLHIAVAGSIVLYAVVWHGSSGSNWGAGGGGDAMGVTLVSSVPLPASAIQTQNVLANESKGLTESLPKTEEKAPEAIPIPDKNAKIKPKPRSSAQQKPKPEPEEEASNVVPFGRRRPGQRPLWNVQCGRGERRIRLHGRRRRFWFALRLVRARGAAEGFRELAQVRSGSAHQRGAEGVCDI